jgi:hypothetical protein
MARFKDHRRKVFAKEAFLEALRNGLSVAYASKTAGVDRAYAYRKRKVDLKFCEEWDQAVEAGTDRLEDEAFKRAVVGHEKKYYDKEGNVTRTEYDKSDVLLMFLLNGRRPEKFNRGQRLDLTNSDNSLKNFAEAMKQINALPPERVPLLIEGEVVRRGE